MSASAANSRQRLLALDALRTVAVLLVLGRHFLHIDESIPRPMRAVMEVWRSFGWIGVDLFFVLSGFLVSGLLFNEYQQYGKLRLLRFLGRRGFKIYPAFYILLGGTWLLFGERFPPRKFLSEMFFVQNYFGFVWHHTWSLAVEEHFYLGLALLLGVLVRIRSGPDPFSILPRICRALLPLVLVLRVHSFAQSPRGYLLLPTQFRIDALLFGTLLSYWWVYHRDATVAWVRKHKRLLQLLCVAMLLPCIVLKLENGFIVNTVGLTTNYLGFGTLIMLAVVKSQDEDWQPGPVITALGKVGFFSYSIYLWHAPVNYLVAAYVPDVLGWAVATLVYLLGTFVVGIVLAKVIEIPFLNLREQLLPSRVKP